MKISKEVKGLLETEKGCLKLIALKLCELVEIQRVKPRNNEKSLFERIFG